MSAHTLAVASLKPYEADSPLLLALSEMPLYFAILDSSLGRPLLVALPLSALDPSLMTVTLI